MNKLTQLRTHMQKNGIDAFFVTNRADIAWLSGFSGSAAYILVNADNAEFITDGRYAEQCRQEIDPCWQVVITKKYIEEFERIGSDFPNVTIQPSTPAYIWNALNKMCKNVQVDSDNILLELRMIKSAEELVILREEYRLAGGAFLSALENWRYGQTENHWAAELEYRIKLAGGRKASFDIIVASGERGALPHGVASCRTINRGEAVTVDFGSFTTYNSDYTRIVYDGDDVEVLKVINIVRESLEKAISAVRSGVKTSELDALAREHIDKAGFGGYFNHGLGHGVGREVHERPTVNSGSDVVLQPSMVFTIEPGIYIPDKFGVRLEETVVVTESGCELLSNVLDRYVYGLD